MSITLDPVPSLDLTEPTRARVIIPIDLLKHFDPTVNLLVPPEKPHYLMRQTRDATLAVAQKLSTTLFGSTQSIDDPFLHGVRHRKDGPAEAVQFTLNHLIGVDEDSAKLNPRYLYIKARIVDGEVVFNVLEWTGEDRLTHNQRYEAEEGGLRREVAAGRLRDEGTEAEKSEEIGG